MKILVTGASGFVGANLVEVLQDAGNKVIATSRSRAEQPGIFYVCSPELGPAADWVKQYFGRREFAGRDEETRLKVLVK